MGINSIARFSNIKSWSLTHTSLIYTIIFTIFFFVSGCASSPDEPAQEETPAASAPAETDSAAEAKTETAPVSQNGTTVAAAPLAANATATPLPGSSDERTIAAPGAILLTPVEILSYADRSVPKRPQKQSDAVTKFCVAQPYAKYKKQVASGINDAWEKTKAGKYGVGFRNKREYNKWNDTQKDFFLYMFDACSSLATCEMESKKNNKKNACGVPKAKFNAWQNSARYFAKTVKSFADGQPPSLCGLRPDSKDASLCFERRAVQISQACSGGVCDELSQCWRSVAIKDDVIRQAESSCGFSGQKLSNCSGYIGAVKTRKDKFNECKNMQSGLSMTLQP